MTNNKQFCTFYLDEYFFGVTVKDVQEIVRYITTTTVPLANNIVSGLINLRGQIVTAIDLRKRLELSARPKDELPMNVVTRVDGEVVSLLVDKIGDVIEVTDDLYERPPETLSGAARVLISGAYKLEDRLLLILDVGKTVDITSGL